MKHPKRVLAGLGTLIRWVAGALVMVGILLYLAGTFNERIAPSDVRAQVVVTPPEGYVLEPATLVREPLIERFSGAVRAVRQTVVSARITAVVRDVLVRPGDTVALGETLAVLDSRDLQASEQQARESLTAAQAQQAETKSDYDRMSALLAKGTINRQTFDAAEAAFRTASANTERARQALEGARVGLTYARIQAPFAATISDRFAEPGDLAAPGVPLLTLYDSSRMRLESFVRESLAVNLQRGTEVEVFVDALDMSLRGPVVEIVPQAEAGSRSFLVKVELPAEPRLFPGLFGRLLLPAGERERLLVPERAIEHVGQLRFVRVGSEGARRLVVPGPPATNGRRELLSGLDVGESVWVPDVPSESR